jgi:hypothetical protein
MGIQFFRAGTREKGDLAVLYRKQGFRYSIDGFLPVGVTREHIAA